MLAAIAIVAFACGNESTVSAPRIIAPSFSVAGGVVGVSCDVDVSANVAIDSSGLRQDGQTVYNLHVTGTASPSARAVTASIAQRPGVTLNLLTTGVGAPQYYESGGVALPAPPNSDSLAGLTQASLDSLGQAPLDLFCNVVRTTSGLALAPSVYGVQGTSTATTSYLDGVSATTTTDVATALPVRRVVSVNGTTVEDAQFEYAAAGDALFRSRVLVISAMAAAGAAFNARLEIVTRNVNRVVEEP